MAFFWFNPFSGERLSSQFVHYLQASNYVGDITSAITASAAVGAVEQRRAIEHASSQVVGSLRNGFDRMAKLNTELKSVVDWRLSVVADQQRVGNLLTRNVALLLRIPDSEKERENLVREGFRFYQNAAIDADLYTDALDYLLRAEALKKQDYFVLHRIGMIYLHAPDAKVRDLAKAEDYFRRAAKYALVENDPRAEPLVRLLSGSVDAPLDAQPISGLTVRNLAAESLLRAAVACHVQEKFTEAAEFAQRAFTVAPSLLEAVYTKALALGQSGDATEVPKLLARVIAQEPVYGIRAALDFATNPEAVTLLSRFKDRAVTRARHLLAGCKKAVVPGSTALPLLDSIASLIERNTLLDATDAWNAMTQPTRIAGAEPASLYQFILRERPSRNEQTTSGASNVGANAASMVAATLASLGLPCVVTEVASTSSFTRCVLRRSSVATDENIATEVHALIPNIAVSLFVEELRVSPGSHNGEVWVELPTAAAARPALATLLKSSTWESSTADMPMLLGVDETGREKIADLTSLGHAVVVGADEQRVAEVVRSVTACITNRHGPNSIRVVVGSASAEDTRQIYSLPQALAPCATEQEVQSNPELFAYDSGEGCCPRLAPLTTFESVAEDEKPGAILDWVVEEIRLRLETFADADVDDFGSFNSRGAHESADEATLEASFVFLNGTPFSNVHREHRRDHFGLPPKLCRLVIILQESSDVTLGFVHEDALKEVLKNGPRVGVHCILGLTDPKSEALAYADDCGVRHRLHLKAPKLSSAPGAATLFSNGEMIWASPDGNHLRVHAPRFEPAEFQEFVASTERAKQSGGAASRGVGNGQPTRTSSSAVRKQWVAVYGPLFTSGMVAHTLGQLHDDLTDYFPQQFGGRTIDAAVNQLIASGHSIVAIEDGQLRVFNRTPQAALPAEILSSLEREVGLSHFPKVVYSSNYGGPSKTMPRESVILRGS
jgi:tetratricopeptide (TPR) repeat protein